MIAITEVDLSLLTAIDPSCAITPTLVINVNPNTPSQSFNGFSLPTGASQNYLSNLYRIPVSPPIYVPAGGGVFVDLFAGSAGCNLGSNGGGDGYATIQYVMQ